MKNNLSLDDLVKQITSSVDPSWSKLKQVRYVYIELGLYLNKNSLLLDNLVNNIKSVKNIDSNMDIMSYSASILLKKCLDSINIESKIDNSNIIVNDIKLSLFNDLIPLKYNMATNIDPKYLDEFLKIDSELGYISVSRSKEKISYFYNEPSLEFFRNEFLVKKKYVNSNDSTIYVNNLLDQNYVLKALEDTLTNIFGCNKEKREFNRLRFDEQINYIKVIIQLLFNNLNDDNCLYDKNRTYLPSIYNIVDLKLIRMLLDASYNLIFIIDNSNNPSYLVYNLSSNKLKTISYEKYIEIIDKNIDSSLNLE